MTRTWSRSTDAGSPATGRTRQARRPIANRAGAAQRASEGIGFITEGPIRGAQVEVADLWKDVEAFARRRPPESIVERDEAVSRRLTTSPDQRGGELERIGGTERVERKEAFGTIAK